MVNIKRGAIFLVNFNPVIGSEQGKIRPAIVLQNNLGNEFGPTTIIAPLTSKEFSKEFSTNVFLSKKDSKLEKDSTILLNQIRVIDKSRILKKLSNELDNEIMKKVDLAIKSSLGLD